MWMFQGSYLWNRRQARFLFNLTFSHMDDLTQLPSTPSSFHKIALFQPYSNISGVWSRSHQPHTVMHFPFNRMLSAKLHFLPYNKFPISTLALCLFSQWRSFCSRFLQQLYCLSIQCGMQSAPFFVCEDNSGTQTRTCTHPSATNTKRLLTWKKPWE